MHTPDLQAVLAAATRLQQLLPDAVLVGGTAASTHAGHRVSFDDGHVLADLRARFGVRWRSRSSAGPTGPIRVPTLSEMLRIKAWLVLRRNTTRDYLDVVALAERLGSEAAARVALELDDYYEDQVGAGGRRIATQLTRQLAEPAPYDLSDVDLRSYRCLDPRWREWSAVTDACAALAAAMLTALAEEAGR